MSKNDKCINSFNMRFLKYNDKLLELEFAYQDARIDILGLAEIRKVREAIIQTKNGNLFCYKGVILGQRRVGFLINTKWKNKLIYLKRIPIRKISDDKTTISKKLHLNNTTGICSRMRSYRKRIR